MGFWGDGLVTTIDDIVRKPIDATWIESVQNVLSWRRSENHYADNG
jgi:hypothetical protein